MTDTERQAIQAYLRHAADWLSGTPTLHSVLSALDFATEAVKGLLAAAETLRVKEGKSAQ